jgi:hypothetical protein
MEEEGASLLHSSGSSGESESNGDETLQKCMEMCQLICKLQPLFVAKDCPSIRTINDIVEKYSALTLTGKSPVQNALQGLQAEGAAFIQATHLAITERLGRGADDESSDSSFLDDTNVPYRRNIYVDDEAKESLSDGYDEFEQNDNNEDEQNTDGTQEDYNEHDQNDNNEDEQNTDGTQERSSHFGVTLEAADNLRTGGNLSLTGGVSIGSLESFLYHPSDLRDIEREIYFELPDRNANDPDDNNKSTTQGTSCAPSER